MKARVRQGVPLVFGPTDVERCRTQMVVEIVLVIGEITCGTFRWDVVPGWFWEQAKTANWGTDEIIEALLTLPTQDLDESGKWMGYTYLELFADRPEAWRVPIPTDLAAAIQRFWKEPGEVKS